MNEETDKIYREMLEESLKSVAGLGLLPDFMDDMFRPGTLVPTGRMIQKAMQYKFPNGMTDDSDHEHAWQIPRSRGELMSASPTGNYWMQWCALCGALSVAQTALEQSDRIVHYPTFIYGEGRRIRHMDAYKVGYAEARLGLPLRDEIKEEEDDRSSAVRTS